MRASEQAPLGRTGLRVTRLGLGSAPLGGLFSAVSEEEAEAVVERAWELGVRFFDTAPLYGSGLAERRLGRVLARKPRDEFVLATKVGRLLRASAPPGGGEQLFAGRPPLNPVFDFSHDGVLRSLEESLERLGLDRVDVLHIHDPDDHYEEALAGAYPALDRLRSEGAIRAVGAGMNQAELLARFAREADFDCFLLAGRYTLLDQAGLAELLPLCAERGISIVIGGVYNSGVLADPERSPTFDYAPADERWVERARRLRAVCERYGVPLKAAAIQFPLGHPAVASVLTGSRSAAELDENARLFDLELPEAFWRELRAEGLLGEAVPTPAGA